MQRLNSRFLVGVKWNLLSSLISQGSVMLGTILAARILGIESYGKFSIIQSTVGMFSSLAGLGLGVTATKYVSEHRNQNPKLVGRILGLCSLAASCTSLLFFLLLFSFADTVSEYMFHSPELSPYVRVASVYVLFFTINGYQQGALVGFEAFSKVSRVSLFTGVSLLLLTICLTWPFGLTGAVLSLVFSSIVSWYANYRALRSELIKFGVVIQYRTAWLERKILRNFVVPAAISGILGGACVWGSNTILIQQMGGFQELAIFNAANQFRTVILFLPSLITRVATPILNNLLGERREGEYNTMFQKNLIITTSIALIAALSISLLSTFLLHLFGRDYEGGRTVIWVLAFEAVIETVGVGFYQTLFVHAKIWLQTAVALGWGTTLIGVSALLAPKYGATGLAIAYLFAYLFNCVSYLQISNRVTFSKRGVDIE